VLAALGDDSSTYYWRILAAREIMRLYRTDRARLAYEQTLQTQKNSAENLLHPQQTTEVFDDPFELGRARADGTLRALPVLGLAGAGIRIDRRMGELAPRLHQSPRRYRALAPTALATVEYIGAAVRAIAHTQAPLILTSTARDAQYQRLLTRRNIEATHTYSLHTTGWAFDVARTYATRSQAVAFQFVPDRLTALNVIAWVREPGAIHVTSGPRASRLRGL